MTATTDLRVAGSDADPPRGSRRRAMLIVAAVTVVVAVVLTWVVAFSSILGVHRVEVRGAHVLSAAQVEAAAGVDTGTPLVRIDTDAVARRVMQLPEVASARVSTSYPTTLVVAVTERQPVGYVRKGSAAVLVDRTGRQYRQLPHPPAGLPRFVVPSGTDATTTGGAVATVAAALPASLLREVRSIEALDPSAITLVLTRQRDVAWGSSRRSADKARLLPMLLAQKHASHVDVSNPDQPFTR